MKCPNCSAELNDNARFCPQCGASIDSTDDALSNHNPIPEHETVSPRRSGGNRAQRRAGKRNKKPDNSKKKPLIIAIIALVLVIAIVLGVIFFVSRKTVSAKELQKAKDNYLPPAQAVTIDTSLSDPSNDAIQFKYDDHARIISCVETTYRAQPIFTKELDYDRVTKPDTFEEVDGYYIRLSKDDLADTGATEPPQETAAPEATEPPTDPPTEPPTEEPTDPTADWKELYIDYLNTTDMEFRSGRLIYLNDDDIPELFLEYKHPISLAHFEICWVNDGAVQNQRLVESIPKYKERSGYILTSSEGVVWTLSEFDGTALNVVQYGSNYVPEYKINDEEVSKEEYEAVTNEFKSWENTYEFNQMTNIDALPDHIRNY